MKKLKIIIREIFKFAVFWTIVFFAGYMAFSSDPETNSLIRLIGFLTVVYFIGDFIYKISNKENSNSLINQ